MALLPNNFSFSRMGLPVIALIGFIAAVLYIAFGVPDRSVDQPAELPAHPSGEFSNAARVAGTGIVEPSSEVIDIGTALAGLVTDLRVQPGDMVEKGAPLFIVDDRAARARLQEAGAAINEARQAIAEAQSAQSTSARQLALYRAIDDPAAVSRAEVIRAEGEASAANSRLALARARLGAAQAAANSARTELGRLTVRAPIAGEILAVNIHPGEYVSTLGTAAVPFIQMGETRPLHVRIDVDEDEALRVKMGAVAQISPRGGAEDKVDASFVRAEPLVVPKKSLTNSSQERVDVRVLQLIYALPQDARGTFRVGQQVDAFIPAKQGDGK